MYGWRARIGVLVPATNSVAETEYRRLADNYEGVSVHVNRVRGAPGPLSREWEEDFAKAIMEASIILSSVQPDVIAVANTAGTFLNSIDEDKMIKDIEGATKIPVVTAARSVVKSLKILKVKRVGVVTPYIEEFNKDLISYLTRNGLEVVDFQTNNTVDILPIGYYEPWESFRLAKKLQGNFEGIFSSCTDFRAIDIIQTLEEDLGVPVISSNLATFSEAIRKVGVKTSIKGFGSLLANRN